MFLPLESCSAFNHTNNGNITLNTNGTTTTLDIQCDVGATVYGSNTVECNDNGNWTGSIPSCGKQSQNIPVLFVLSAYKLRVCLKEKQKLRPNIKLLSSLNRLTLTKAHHEYAISIIIAWTSLHHFRTNPCYK